MVLLQAHGSVSEIEFRFRLLVGWECRRESGEPDPLLCGNSAGSLVALAAVCLLVSERQDRRRSTKYGGPVCSFDGDRQGIGLSRFTLIGDREADRRAGHTVESARSGARDGVKRSRWISRSGNRSIQEARRGGQVRQVELIAVPEVYLQVVRLVGGITVQLETVRHTEILVAI